MCRAPATGTGYVCASVDRSSRFPLRARTHGDTDELKDTVTDATDDAIKSLALFFHSGSSTTLHGTAPRIAAVTRDTVYGAVRHPYGAGSGVK